MIFPPVDLSSALNEASPIPKIFNLSISPILLYLITLGFFRIMSNILLILLKSPRIAELDFLPIALQIPIDYQPLWHC